ncbi:MAG: Flp family type IVb pilin [Rhizomicrobium sp.]
MRDKSGATAIEYAMIAGMISILIFAGASSIGGTLLGFFRVARGAHLATAQYRFAAGWNQRHPSTLRDFGIAGASGASRVDDAGRGRHRHHLRSAPVGFLRSRRRAPLADNWSGSVLDRAVVKTITMPVYCVNFADR